jgi:formate-dependent nitrite reductase membrane component NrfD
MSTATFVIIFIIGLVLGLGAAALSLYINKRKSQKIKRLFYIQTVVSFIAFLLILPLIFCRLENDYTKYWSTFFGYLKNQQVIVTCIIFITVPIFNKLYARYQQKKELQKKNPT